MIIGLCTRSVGTLLKAKCIATSICQLNRKSVILRSFRCISNEAKEVFTNINNEEDPNRDAIFKYSWGTWLKNDEAEKKKRYTRFSLGGVQTVLKQLYEDSRLNTENKETKVVAPKKKDEIVSLPHNVSVKNFGSKNPNEEFHIKQLSSLHEGKHHRIYKVETNTLKSFILRIPYPLDSEYAIEKRIQSEVATLDFVDLKLGLKVPKVFAYGANSSNPVKTPFILEEFIEGETLMKQWAPMTPHTDPKHKEIIGKVINPLSNLQARLAGVVFNKYGSLYFNIESKTPLETATEPYNDEENESLRKRWFIGPSTERVYWRNKSMLKKAQVDPYIGPWNAKTPLKMISDIAEIELENLRAKLSILNSDAAAINETKEELEQQIESFINLQKVAPFLMDSETKAVKNIEELFKPRLGHTEIDPLNVLVDKDGETMTFLDFEGATIKPIIFQSTPRFVAYEDGPKIYEFEIDETKYKEMSESDKYYYDFAVARTRNEVQWDLNLGKTFTELGTEGSPILKRLRGPYLTAVERRNAKETPLIDRKIYELALQWPQFKEHNFVGAEEFPVKVDPKLFEENTKTLEQYYEEIGTIPFAVTGGWVPQDLFDQLLSQNIIKKLDNGDYDISQEAVQHKEKKFQ